MLNGNQFPIVGCKGFTFRIADFRCKGPSGAFVQNLKTFKMVWSSGVTPAAAIFTSTRPSEAAGFGMSTSFKSW